MLSIGSVNLSPPILLAPMAGISDLPFRMLNREFGCGFAFTEMISAKSVLHGSRQTMKMLSTSEEDRPLGLQLLGSDADILTRALETIGTDHYEVVDLNAACPVSKVVSKQEGSGLLREPEKLGRILTALVKASPKPVTVKIRAGWDEDSVNAEEIAARAEQAGVSAVIIHGRTTVQGYSGTVNYGIIAKVRKKISIPVVASGDAMSPVLIRKMFGETGCSGVAIARGSLGAPWIFRNTHRYLETGELPDAPEPEEIASVMTRHLAAVVAFHGETPGVKLFRKFFAWYARGVSRELKRAAFGACTEEEMAVLIRQLADSAALRRAPAPLPPAA